MNHARVVTACLAASLALLLIAQLVGTAAAAAVGVPGYVIALLCARPKPAGWWLHWQDVLLADVSRNGATMGRCATEPTRVVPVDADGDNLPRLQWRRPKLPWIDLALNELPEGRVHLSVLVTSHGGSAPSVDYVQLAYTDRLGQDCQIEHNVLLAEAARDVS